MRLLYHGFNNVNIYLSISQGFSIRQYSARTEMTKASDSLTVNQRPFKNHFRLKAVYYSSK
jgi:hypothetical protein